MSKLPERLKIRENLGSIHWELTDIPLEQVISVLQGYIDSNPGRQLSLDLTYEMDYQYPTPMIQLLSNREQTDEEYAKTVAIYNEMKDVERKARKAKKEKQKKADSIIIKELKKRYPEEFK